MKRITIFAASYFSTPRKTRCLIYSTLALLIIISSYVLTTAQSTDRDNPTQLTSNGISGMIDSDSRGNSYYYSFMANPGEISITLTVEPSRRVNDSDRFLTTIGFNLFDRNAVKIASKKVSTHDLAEAEQAVARVNVTRRQLMVLSINIPGDIFSNIGVGGKYRVRLSGTVDIGQSESYDPTPELVKKQNKVCDALFQKRGVLRVKMNDGSIKRIDLSQAEEITIEP
jgi:hypothetical protein